MDAAEITLEPWNPWPLLIPAVLLATGVVLVFVGTLRARRWARDLGVILVVGGSLLGIGLLAFLSGTWDQEQRRVAMVELGYVDPTFGGSSGVVGSTTPGDVEFQAVRDGEPVGGELRWLGGDRWQVVEDGGR